MQRPFTPAHEASLKTLRKLLASHGLEAHAPLIESLARPTIGLRTRLPTPADLEVGASRFGGEPDVPASFAWPKGDRRPMMFVAQIRLEQVAPHDLDALLPIEGLLSIFSDATGWPVFAHVWSAHESLARRPWPDNVRAYAEGDHPFKFRTAGVDVVPFLDLPETITWPDGGPLTKRGLDDRYYDALCAHTAAIFATAEIRCDDGVVRKQALHVMLGYARANSYADVPETVLVDPAQLVVLAYDSDDLVGMEWGDAQRVWLLADRDALAKGDLRGVRCAL